MRVLSLATFAAVLATFVTANLDEPARPRPAEHGADIRRLQARRKEIEVRATYPELFQRSETSGSPPCRKLRKRGDPSDFESSPDLQVLSPRQIAELIIRRGEYTQ